MATENELSWLAGLIDAEGSLGLRRIKSRKSQVFSQVFLGMVDRRAIEKAKLLAQDLYGAPLATHERMPSKIGSRTLYSFNMVAKRSLFCFLGKIIPYLRFKRAEAVLQYDFLSRASAGRYVATDHDRWLCEMSERIKQGDTLAKHEALLRVRDDFPHCGSSAAWLAGYTDGDGSISVATGTKSVLVSYWARDREELEFARRVAGDVSGTTMPALAPARSALSTHPQWRLDVRGVSEGTALLLTLLPHLYVKQAQATLALLLRRTSNAETRASAVALIHGLNKGSVEHDDANRFLARLTAFDTHPSPK